MSREPEGPYFVTFVRGGGGYPESEGVVHRRFSNTHALVEYFHVGLRGELHLVPLDEIEGREEGISWRFFATREDLEAASKRLSDEADKRAAA
jgi:hypothetical protein